VGSRRPSFDKRKGSGRDLIRCGVLGEVIRSTSAFADRIAGAWSAVHQGSLYLRECSDRERRPALNTEDWRREAKPTLR
jgi:hypothetical protein